jgi:triosephosphate isomerase
MKRPIVAGNWKMHKTPQEGRSFVEKTVNLLLDMDRVQVIFCPPFPALFDMERFLKQAHISLGAQNCHWEDQGAYTGEVSPTMLTACAVEYVIVGHSERRHIFHEPDIWINRKVKAVLSAGMKPILCIGETLQERQQGRTEQVLIHQLTEGLNGVKTANGLVVAYEPVWAIGTGVNAEPEQVAEAHRQVRDALSRLIPEQTEIPILYGGSVNPGNARELIETPGVDGFLVGGASLNSETFVRIIRIVAEHYVRT